MKMTRIWLIVAIVGLLIPTASLSAHPLRQAQRTVTLCGVDNATGAGWNLRNALAGGNVVVRFNCGNRTTLRITSTLDIAGNVTIFGGGGMTLTGGDEVVLFQMLPGSALRLNGLTITGGRYTGPIRIFPSGASISSENRVYDAGVIRNPAGGSITIERSEFIANRQPISSVNGAITIRDSRFFGNTRTVLENYFGVATVERSSFRDNTDSFFGGAIANIGGTLTVRDNTQFSTNQALSGGAILNSSGTLVVEDAIFSRNQARVNGGAITLWGQGDVTVTRSRFEQNTAQKDGGAVFQSAVSSPVHILRINHSTFVNNAADRGGAIANAPDQSEVAGALILRSVTFSRNSAREGGAIAAGETSLDLVAVAMIGNEASEAGAAIALRNSVPRASRLANSLIVRNQSGPGMASILANFMTLTNTTLAENQGGLAFFGPLDATPPIELANTILFANAGGNCHTAGMTDNGHNLQYPGADCGASIPVAYPWLDSRYAPYGWSPALSAGNLGVCDASPINGIDLFGQRRGLNGACASGALERNIDRLVRPPREG